MQSKLPSAVLCACWRCHVLIGITGDVICVGGWNMGTERDQMKKKQKEEHTTTRIRPVTALCLLSKESTAQNDTAPQRGARHGTARRCAALLGYT